MGSEHIIHDTIPPLAAAMEQSTGILEHVNANIPWDIILITYCLIFFDLFYGVIISTIKGEAVSHKMLKGLHNKIFVLFVPIVGILLKIFFVVCSLPSEWSGTSTLTGLFGVSALSQFPICFLLCLFVIAMEFLSFLENSAKVDKRAKRLLDFVQRKADKDEDIKKLMLDDEDIVSSK